MGRGCLNCGVNCFRDHLHHTRIRCAVNSATCTLCPICASDDVPADVGSNRCSSSEETSLVCDTLWPSIDRAHHPPCLASLDWARVGCLTNSAPQIPALVMSPSQIHVTMLATEDGWGGHISTKWRAPSDNILDNSGRLLKSPCALASWKSACRSSNQFLTSFGTWQGINGIRPCASRRDDACRVATCFFTTR